MTFAHWLGAGGDIEAGRWADVRLLTGYKTPQRGLLRTLC